MATPGTPRSYEFRREREATWAELERLVERFDRRGVRGLDAAELARLPHLYRATLSSLSVARAISLDQNVVAYLESLAARAYFCVYGTRRHLSDALRDFFRFRFPAAVRAARRPIAVAAALLLLGAAAGFLLTRADPDRFYTFVGADYAGGRNPSASTQELRSALYDQGGPAQALATFASFLFSNNAKIGIVAFALGFVFGVPVFVLMFLNGLIVGAFAALYHGRGLSLDLWGWLLPHGVTELSAVVLCGGAGLVLAQVLVLPGRHRRVDSLALRGRDAGIIVLGAVVMFFIAALIEGIFRQRVQSVPARYAVAAATAILWTLYFGFAGRSRDGGGDGGRGREPGRVGE